MIARCLLLLALCTLQASALTLTPAVAALRRAPAASSVTMMAGMRAGDAVQVISGDSKGTVGKVLMVDTKKGKILVEGVNIKTKHVKPMKEGESGSILKKEAPISISNVKLSDEQPAAAEEA